MSVVFFDSVQVNFFKYLGISLKTLSKITKKGNGTSLPGLVVEKYYPKLIKLLAKNYKNIILITGTNGKTTTRGIICHLLKNNSYKVCTNQGGANILRGIITTLLNNLDYKNQPKSDYLVLEVEEATMPILTKFLKPDQIILTNIFRDQMDAYGEINQTLDYFDVAITNSLAQNSDLKILANGDDTKLSNYLNQKRYAKLINYFGVESNNQINNQIQFESAEETHAINPNQIIKAKLISNNGINISFQSSNNSSDSSNSNHFDSPQLSETRLNLSGLYNLYNAWSAILATKNLLTKTQIQTTLPSFGAIFGRGEVINIDDKTITLFLVKNPAGFDQILQTLNYLDNANSNNGLIISINDNIADGRDVSWLWDVEFEKYFDSLNANFNQIITSGTRGLDMLLRLEIDHFKNLTVENNYKNNSQNLLSEIMKSNSSTPPIANWTICATYTAMLEIRSELAKITPLKNIDNEDY